MAVVGQVVKAPGLVRRVVLLVGPPGAGKSTAARSLGLAVFDRDDPCWRDEERRFVAAISGLRFDGSARAAVIRCAASSRARARWAGLIGATEVWLVLEDPDVCVRRVVERHRPRWRQEVVGVRSWFAGFDDADGVRRWPGAAKAVPQWPLSGGW